MRNLVVLLAAAQAIAAFGWWAGDSYLRGERTVDQQALLSEKLEGLTTQLSTLQVTVDTQLRQQSVQMNEMHGRIIRLETRLERNGRE